MPSGRGIWCKHRRSEVDRRIERKIVAARARMALATREPGLWQRLRLIWARRLS
jgi:hypothetical protein